VVILGISSLCIQDQAWSRIVDGMDGLPQVAEACDWLRILRVQVATTSGGFPEHRKHASKPRNSCLNTAPIDPFYFNRNQISTLAFHSLYYSDKSYQRRTKPAPLAATANMSGFGRSNSLSINTGATNSLLYVIQFFRILRMLLYPIAPCVGSNGTLCSESGVL
jgi:hypothetical protein